MSSVEDLKAGSIFTQGPNKRAASKWLGVSE